MKSGFALIIAITLTCAISLDEAAASRRVVGKTRAQQSLRKPASIKLTRKIASTPHYGTTEGQKPLNVRGQSRNFSMMLVVKDQKDRIRFGEIRDTFSEEVSGTNF